MLQKAAISIFGLSFFSRCWASEQLSIPQGVLSGSGLDTIFIAKGALFIALVLLGTIACGRILGRLFLLPTVAGQIIGGIILGPSVFNLPNWHYFKQPLYLFDQATGAFYSIASSDLFVFFLLLLSSALTVSYLLWIAGHETDVRDIAQVGLTALIAGVLGAVLPIIFTWLALYPYELGISTVQALSLGLIFSATSVSIPVATLFSYNKMHLRSSKVTLGAAIIDDIFAVFLLSFFFILLQSGTFGQVECFLDHCHTKTFGEALVYMIFAFSVLFLTGYYIIPQFNRFLKKHHQTFLLASVANGVMLLYFSFSELMGGLAGITGAYFAGLFHRMGDYRHHAEKVISPYVNTFLLPLFLGSIGLTLNIRVVPLYGWFLVALLLTLAIISKLLGCYLATGLSNLFGNRDANRWTLLDGYLFGSSMVARGEVGLVIATVVYSTKIITSELYVIAVMVIILSTIVAPIMLAIGFSRLELVPLADGDYTLNIGLFKVIGTTQLYHIIVGKIERSKEYKTSVQMSEGRKIINVEGQNVKVILCPEEGIIFKGDKQKIKQIMQMVRESVMEEIERLA